MENQTVKNFEVLVVDDGSTLTDPEPVLQKSSLTWRLIRIQENVGIETALNVGIDAVETNWFSRFDSDDEMLPRRIEIELTAIEEHPSAVLIASGAMTSKGLILPAKSEFMYHVQFGCPFVHAASCFNACKIPSPLYERKVRAAEDWLMWKKVIESGGEIVTVQEPIIRYRIHGANSSIGVNDAGKISRYQQVAREVLNVPELDLGLFLMSTGKFPIPNYRAMLKVMGYVLRVNPDSQRDHVSLKSASRFQRNHFTKLICIFADTQPLWAILISLQFANLKGFGYAFKMLFRQST
jgi:glycosyltransferase involved in cell wall biosynthesis